MLLAQALDVDAFGETEFGGENDLIAPSMRLDGAPEDAFAFAERIHVRGIEEIDAAIQGGLHDQTAERVVANPGCPLGIAERHHAEADLGNGEIRSGDLVGVHAAAPLLKIALPRSSLSSRGPTSVRSETPQPGQA